MTKLVMERKSSDNKYLHRDFHISTDNGIGYVGEKYGDIGVEELLREFSSKYFQKLVNQYSEQGLVALKEYIENIYATEESEDAVEIEFSEKTLSVKVKYCPAVRYMKSQGHTPSKWYKMTTSVVYDQLAKDCGIHFEMGAYNEENGQTDQYQSRQRNPANFQTSDLTVNGIP